MSAIRPAAVPTATPHSPALAVSVADLGASYGEGPVLQGVSFHLAPGELLAVLGPSGCGKTTLLRCLAGFERIESGRISLADAVVALRRVHVPAHRRHVAVVPQDGALFPHLSVAENVGFGLKKRRPGRIARIQECLALVDLAGYGDRMPHELSGGQQQRVALARALAPRPPLILLDEPFGALDAALRTGLRRDVREALKEDHATAVLVTHDQAEALSVADRVAVLREGRLHQLGTPDEVYRFPADTWVATFVGEAALLPLTALGSGEDGAPVAHTALGPVRVHGERAATAAPGDLVVARPEDVTVEAITALHGVEEFSAPAVIGVDAVVAEVDYRGHESVAVLRLDDGTKVRARITGAVPALDTRVRVSLRGPCAVVPADEPTGGPAEASADVAAGAQPRRSRPGGHRA
ncbi:MAG: ABC transporter ATP-binding protein [Micrococcus sp.]|nr:ABC transporter ATP-binding protein [Micrococcus sp.]